MATYRSPKNKNHELVYEAYALDFTDEEHEIMSIIGALDAMHPREKQYILNAYPKLVDRKIEEPETPEYQTRNGDLPRIEFSCFTTGGSELRFLFNNLAQNLKQEKQAIGIEENSVAESVCYRLRDSARSYRGGLSSVAEEIGKTRIGLKNEGTDVFMMRLYDYNETYKPAPPPYVPHVKEVALEVLKRQDPAIIQIILAGLKSRGINPLPDNAGNDVNARLPEPEFACK